MNMELIGYSVLAVLAIAAALDVCRQYLEAMGLFRYLHREAKNADRLPDESLPKAAIVLALRGPDPQLRETLPALLSQDYPNFVIQVVVDNEQDPVLKDVVCLQKESDRIRLSVLEHPGPHCSLKCSSLIQAVNCLEPDVEAVAFIDGDVVPHPGWLRELISPIVAGQADVTGGNRWYLPLDNSWGSLVRYFWNAGFMREMWTQGAPWAGTMAMMRSTIGQIGLLEAWNSAMSVDATLHRCMNRHHQRFKLVGSLLMTNRESISISQFHSWVTRQMAVIRYTASHTVKSVQLHVATLLLLHLLVSTVALASLTAGHLRMAGTASAILLCYWFLLASGAGVQEVVIQKTLKRNPGNFQWMTPLKLLMWYPGIVVTHWVLVFGILKSLRMTAVNWRGITYQLHRNGGVRMDAYRPFGSKWNQPDNHSVV